MNVVRLFLAVWLVAFAAQATGLFASVLPDQCVGDTSDSAADPCPDDCARCVCCARLPIFVPQADAPGNVEAIGMADALPLLQSPASPAPRGILHVPKGSLTDHR